MKHLALLITILGTLLTEVAVTATTEGVSFDVAASCSEMSTEDTLSVSVVVTIVGDEGGVSIQDLPLPEIDGFMLTSSSSSSMRSIQDSLLTVTRSTVCLFRPLGPGEFTIPTVTLDYVDQRTGITNTLSSAPITVSVLPAGGGAGRSTGIIVLAAFVLVMILSSVFIYARVQRGRKSAAEQPEPGEAESEFVERLRKADVSLAHGKLADGQAMAFEALREFMKDRYGFTPASHAHGAILESQIPKQLQDNYITLAEWDDELKYGGLPKPETEIKSVVEQLRRFLEQLSAL
jgi:hypothetical protein